MSVATLLKEIRAEALRIRVDVYEDCGELQPMRACAAMAVRHARYERGLPLPPYPRRRPARTRRAR